MTIPAEPIETRDIARALVFDPQDRLLLIEYEAVRPIESPSGPVRSFWFMPGGGLEPGESHEEACRRELSEEIGVGDVSLGPPIATCEGAFYLFETPRYARERYFLVRLPDDRIDTSRLAETEASPVRGTRWWTFEELAQTGERIEPLGLVTVMQRIISHDVPAHPVALRWHDR